MKKILNTLMAIFSAGCMGGFTNSIILWIFGFYGITQAAGVNIAPTLTPAWLYPRIVWGGIWGLLFLFPISGRKYLLRGFLFSLAPTIVQLFVIFPLQAHKGMMGLDLGVLTPLFVVFFNFVWGLTASTVLMVAENKK